MKRTIALLTVLLLGGTVALMAQEKVKVEKRVEVKENNGVKQVTVKETRDGKTTEKVYTGAEADAILKEAEMEMEQHAKQEGKEVKMEKKVVIKEEKESDKKKQ
jgi:hypothetical protein